MAKPSRCLALLLLPMLQYPLLATPFVLTPFVLAPFVLTPSAVPQEQSPPPQNAPGSFQTPIHPVLSPDAEKRVTALEDQVEKLREKGKFVHAIPAAKEILEIRRNAQGDTWWQTGNALMQVHDLECISKLSAEDQASVCTAECAFKELNSLVKNRRYNEANKLLQDQDQRFQDYMELEKRVFGKDHCSRAHWLTLQGHVMISVKKMPQAETLFRKSLAIYKSHFGNVNHPSIACCLYHVSSCLRPLKKWDEALPSSEAALKMFRACYVDQENQNIRASLTLLSDCYFNLHRYADALPHLEALLVLNRKKFAKKDPARLLSSLTNLSLCLEYLGKYSEALPRWEEGLALSRRVFKNQVHPGTAACLSGAGRCLSKLGKPAEALPRLEAAVKMNKQLGRILSPARIAVSMRMLGRCLFSLKRHEDALSIFEDALEIYQKLYKGRDHVNIADCQNDMGKCLNALDKPAKALLQHEAALEMSRKYYTRTDHPYIATCLFHVASSLSRLFRHSEALQNSVAALEISKRIFKNRDHHNTALYLYNLGVCLHDVGRSAEAIPKLEAALAMYQRLYKGHDHSSIVFVMLNEASCLMDLGRSEEAMVKLASIHEMNKRLYKDRDHPRRVNCMLKNVECLDALGKIHEALVEARAALEMSRRIHGHRDHPAVAFCIRWIGGCLVSLGKPAEALIRYEEALDMFRRVDENQDRPWIGLLLMNIGCCLEILGRHDEALRKYESSVKIMRNVYGQKDHRSIVPCLSRLARGLALFGRQAEALPLHKASLAMNRRLYGDRDEFNTASCLNNLAVCLLSLDRPGEALPMFQAALEMNRRLYRNQDHPDTSACMMSVARSLDLIGKHTEAVSVYRATLAMHERLFPGQIHRQMPKTWNYLANCYLSLGRTEDAYRAASKSVQMLHDHLTVNFPTLSVQEKTSLISKMLQKSLDIVHTLSFQGQTKNVRPGLLGTLRMKGLVFEALCRERSKSLERGTPARDLKFDRLNDLRRQYAASALQTCSTEKASQFKVERMQKLWKTIKAFEQELSRENKTYVQAARLQSIGIEEVARSLSPGHALLEYVRYRPIDPGQKTSTEDWRYGVYVLVGGSREVHAIDLGPADEIDASIKAFHKTLNEQIGLYTAGGVSATRMQKDEAGLARLSAEIRVRIFDRVAAAVRGCRRLYVAPDGLLGNVPFEALAVKTDGQEIRYLVESSGLELVYLTTGRDLPRLQTTAGDHSKRVALLVGDPDFNASPAQVAKVVTELKYRAHQKRTAQTDGELSTATVSSATMGLPAEIASIPSSWPRLPAVGSFLDRTKELLGQKRKDLEVRVHAGCQAVEEAVLDAHSPFLLQFATHGYFLKKSDHKAAPQWFNPMLRSMLVLAGANTRRDREDHVEAGGELMTRAEARTRGLPEKDLVPVPIGDGLLTAYEVTGMNLRGTQLVNLTACQTGLGELTAAEGIAGLRSAFLLAGARAITMSLWNVPEDKTLRQMDDFYSEWMGKGRARYASFRQSKLAALQRAREDQGSGHPFWWAGFVYIGDPGDLPGTPMNAGR